MSKLLRTTARTVNRRPKPDLTKEVRHRTLGAAAILRGECPKCRVPFVYAGTTLTEEDAERVRAAGLAVPTQDLDGDGEPDMVCPKCGATHATPGRSKVIEEHWDKHGKDIKPKGKR